MPRPTLIALVILGVLVLIALSGSAGYVFAPNKQLDLNPIFEKKSLWVGPQSIVKSQQVIATGKISKVTDNSLTITKDGSELTLELATQINIFPESSTSAKPPVVTYDKSKLKIGDAIIVAELENEDYKVKTVTYQKI